MAVDSRIIDLRKMKAKVDPYKIEMKAVVTEEVQEYIDASV
jgi:hypothetical protein